MAPLGAGLAVENLQQPRPAFLWSSSLSSRQVIPRAPPGLPLACLQAAARSALAVGHGRMLPFILPRAIVTAALPGAGTVTRG